MVENVINPQVVKPKVSVAGNMVKMVIALVVSVLVGTVLHYFLKQVMIINTSNVMAIWVISFILAFVTKMNYQKPIFLILVLLGSVLVSLYPFGQGFTIYLLLIAIGRKLKMA